MNKAYHLIHVIPNESGGGAERLVFDLQLEFKDIGVTMERVHFCGKPINAREVTRFGLKHDSLLNIWRLRKFVKSRLCAINKPLVIHTHLTHASFFARIALIGLPVIWVHTEHSTSKRLRKIWLFRTIEGMVLRKCSRVVAISPGVRESLLGVKGLKKDKVNLIYNGARNFGLAHRTRVAGRALRFVSVGSLREVKGFDIVLTALASASIGDWHYTIVGQGELRSDLINLARKLGILDRVSFVGWSDCPEIYYSQADLQLLPSRWEGFPLVIIEALSTGLRVLSSDLLGLRDVLGSDARICHLVRDHLEPKAWVSAIESEAYRLRSKSSPTEPAAAEWAASFSIGRMAREHNELYLQVIGGRGSIIN